MIPAKHDRVFESTMPALETAGYTFDQSDLRHIAEVLRTIYSDPVGAVVREYSANAVDAHRYAGTPEKPFDLHVPTLDEPFISWRDYGPGLSDKDLKEKLLGYGASGKRGSNLDIGGFGIGAKCGYAVSDQFTFTSYFGGKRTVWHCYLNEDGDSKSDKISCEDSAEPTGIAVNIPVRVDSLSKFEEAISNAFLFYRTRPKIIGPEHVKTRVTRKLPKPFLHGKFTMADRSGNEVEIVWEAIKDPDYSDRVSRHEAASNLAFARVVMGGVSYPINLESVGGGLENNETFLRRVILTAPVGFFKLAPSRESLTYNTSVCGTLSKLFNAVLETATSSVEKEIQEPTNTCRRRSDLYGSLVSLLGSGTKKLDEMLEKKFWVRGNAAFVMPNNRVMKFVSQIIEFRKETRYFLGIGYRSYWKRTHRQLSIEQVLTFSTDANLVIAIENPGTDEVQLGALAKQYLYDRQDAEEFSVICVKDGELANLKAECPWLSDGSVPSMKREDLKPAAKEIIEEFAFVRPEQPQVTYSSSSRTKYAQHGKKFVKLNNTVINYGTMSQNWSPVLVKNLPDTRKIYVIIDSYQVQLGSGENKTFVKSCQVLQKAKDTQWLNIDIAEFRRLVDELQKTKEFEELNDGVLGIKVADAPSIEGDPEFVYFWEYIKEKMEALIASGVSKESLRIAWDLCRVHHSDLLTGLLTLKSLFWPAFDSEFRLRDCALSRAVVDLNTGFGPARDVMEKILIPLHYFFLRCMRFSITDAVWLTGSVNANPKWDLEQKGSDLVRDLKDIHPAIAAMWKEIEKTGLFKSLREIVHEFVDQRNREWNHGIGLSMTDFYGSTKLGHIPANLWLQEGRKQTKKETT